MSEEQDLYNKAYELFELDSKSLSNDKKIEGYRLLGLAAKTGSQVAIDNLVKRANSGVLNPQSQALPAELKEEIIKILAEKGIDVTPILTCANRLFGGHSFRAWKRHQREAQAKAKTMADERKKRESDKTKPLGPPKTAPLGPPYKPHSSNRTKLSDGALTPINAQAARGAVR